MTYHSIIEVCSNQQQKWFRHQQRRQGGHDQHKLGELAGYLGQPLSEIIVALIVYVCTYYMYMYIIVECCGIKDQLVDFVSHNRIVISSKQVNDGDSGLM